MVYIATGGVSTGTTKWVVMATRGNANKGGRRHG